MSQPTQPVIELPSEVTDLLARLRAEVDPANSNTDYTTIVQETITLLDRILALPDRSTDVTTLQTRVTDLQRQLNERPTINALQEARDQVDLQEGVINDLRAQLQDTRDISAALARNQPGGGNRVEKIPNPEKFTGKDQSKLRPFLTQLRLEAATYTDEQAKLYFAVNSLSDEALDQVIQYVQNNNVNLTNLNALVTILENAFGDPNRVANAEYKLYTIIQGTRDFVAYFAEFQRHAAETTWNDVAKLAALKRGLSFRLQQDLLRVHPEPTTFDEFVAVCQRLDTRRRALQSQFGNRFGSSTSRPATRPGLNAPIVSPTPSATLSTATGTHAGPMDISAGRRKVLPEERAKRMAESRCYYCGGLGHGVKTCPQAQRRPL